MQNYASLSYELDYLLGLPARNLEGRISLLEEELKQRDELQKESISRLKSHSSELFAQKSHLKFLLNYPDIRMWHAEVSGQLLQVDSMLARIGADSFRDMQRMKEKLWEAKEALEREKAKLKLLK